MRIAWAAMILTLLLGPCSMVDALDPAAPPSASPAPAPLRSRYFSIEVVDDQTDRGVPLVELATTNKVRYYTDSNGLVALDDPGLMDRPVFFTIKSDGYAFPLDGFGFHGVALQTT